jgi:GT2 family glycosyltransferase
VLRMRLAPPGTRRAALLRIARDSLAALQEEGLGAFFRHWGRGLVSRDLRIPAGVKHIDQVNAESYPGFVARTTPSPADLERQRAENQAWKDRPLISFVTPVYKPPVHVLRAAIESVLAQSYEGWELCLADASPDAPEVRELLAGFAGRDPRIRVQFLDQNLGISGNSNAALAMAAGEYVAILDHDDVLAPHMLHEVVRRIRTDRFADVVYFDEDKLSEDGAERRDPFFKPDFSPEMLVSANYLTHAVYRRSLVEAAGGFDPDYEGCQDWDLAFKVTERTREVVHIPQVLYHWRQVSGSTAGEFGAKSYVFERQLACVRDHLERSGLAGVSTGFPAPGFLHARWPASGAKVSIVIPTRDRVELLSRTIRSLREVTAYPAYEFILVDNGSEQPRTRRYLDDLRAEPDVRIVDYAEKFNYSRANNLGAAQATGEILLFLNNDVEILHPDWLEEMVRWADRPEIGVVGAKLLYPDRTIQHAGVIVGMEGHASHVFWGYRERQSGPFGSVDWYRNFTAVTGACMMVRRGIFEAAGGFDEKYILAFSDIEFCMRVIERGLRVVYTPHARLVHFEGKSRGDHIPSNDIRVGLDDFMPLVERGDPFYNPNLSYVERKPMIRPADEEDRVSRLLRVAAGARVDDLTRT